MWELIAANQRKSIILLVGMGLSLLVLGFLIGTAFSPIDGGLMGLFIALGLWTVMFVVSMTAGDAILLSVSQAQPVTPEILPQLYNVVEEMKIAANLPVMPKLYVINDAAPNAFATGLDIKKSSIVVTTGLLSKLNRDELQGVIAHETSHILNRDIRFMTIAGIFLGSITLISEIFLRGMYYSSYSSRRYSSSNSRGGGQAQMLMMVVALVFAILAPICAQLLYFAISRKREYLADASGARLTRYPEGLACALEKISRSTEDLHVANKVTAPMYIVNPLKPPGLALSNLTSTHPPIEERIKILRNMMVGAGANYQNYQQAYQTVRGVKENIIPASGLSGNESMSIRTASQETVPPTGQDSASQLRHMGDITRAINGFSFIVCACGLKIKTPPNFNQTKIDCPRCHQEIKIPLAPMASVGAVLDVASNFQSPKDSSSPREKPEVQTQQFTRQTSSWESFQCSCGNVIHVPPTFLGLPIKCPKCHQPIEVTG